MSDSFKPPLPKVEDVTRVKALECIDFRLVSGVEDLERPGFRPTFAHQHFGDEEMIAGYEGLRISHYYSCGSLQLCTRIVFDRRDPLRADDVAAKLRFYMPDEDCEGEEQWSASSPEAVLERVRLDAKNGWQPPGQQIAGYTVGAETFQIRRANIADPGMRQYWQRMRPFLIWFVDAANYFDDTDERWDVFMLFREPKKDAGCLCFCGFATIYNFFAWKGRSKDAPNPPERFASAAGPQIVSPAVEELVTSMITHSYPVQQPRQWYERRVRVSQFLVLPPWQRAGHGARLFETLCQWARSFYAPVRDITVEGDETLAF